MMKLKPWCRLQGGNWESPPIPGKFGGHPPWKIWGKLERERGSKFRGKVLKGGKLETTISSLYPSRGFNGSVNILENCDF